jgi:hypothetical protein
MFPRLYTVLTPIIIFTPGSLFLIRYIELQSSKGSFSSAIKIQCIYEISRRGYYLIEIEVLQRETLIPRRIGIKLSVVPKNCLSIKIST